MSGLVLNDGAVVVLAKLLRAARQILGPGLARNADAAEVVGTVLARAEEIDRRAQRITVAERAAAEGVSEAAIRARARRETIGRHKDDDGRWRVDPPDVTPVTREDDRDLLRAYR